MGTCISYISCQNETANLAKQNISSLSNSFLPEYPDHPSPDLASPDIASEISDQNFLKDDSSIEQIEINHFLRPMIRRSLTNFHFTTPQPIDLHSLKSKLRRTASIIPSPKKASFLHKAKERLRRQNSTNQFFFDRVTEDNVGDTTSHTFLKSLTDRSTKEDNYLMKANGDQDTEVN